MPMSLPVLHLIAAEEATFSSVGTVLYRQERTHRYCHLRGAAPLLVASLTFPTALGALLPT